MTDLMRSVLRYVVAAIFLAMPLFTAGPSSAQIKFQFEGGDQLAIAYLEGLGYTEVKVLANEFVQVRVEACKDGIRYRFKVRIDGRIFDTRKIGSCGAITAGQARRILEEAGYFEIELTERDNGFLAFACKQNRRFRLLMRADGTITHTKPVGACQQDLSRSEIAAILRNLGYDGIDFQRSNATSFLIHACLGRAKFELIVDPRGNIRSERRIGLCEQEIDPRRIPQILEARGFTRVEVVDDRLPGYVAIACKDGNRIEVTLNRFGKIVGTKRLGRCARALDAQEIVEILRQRGFARIVVVSSNDQQFVMEACYKGRKLRMVFDLYGDFVSERDLGGCQSRRVSEILEELSDKGISDAQIHVEGCRGNRRIRIPVDRLGDLGRRERIGSC